MASSPSLQEVLRKRHRELFVGRSREMAAFSANLRLPPDDPHRFFVFNVFGQGGMGKTTLLRRFKDSAEAGGAATAWTDDSQADVIGSLNALALDLAAYDTKALQDFLDEYGKYRDRRHELEADPDAPAALGAVVGAAIGRGGVRLGRHIPAAGAVFDFIGEDSAADQLGEVGAFISRRLKNRADVELIQDPLGRLVPLFLDGIRSLSKDRPLALFFDTYESTGQFLDKWLLNLLTGTYGSLPAAITLVIAGRNELDRNSWSHFESAIIRLELEPLTKIETTDLLGKKGVTDERAVDAIARLSHGLPLLVATLSVGTPIDPVVIEEGTDTAVERFLKWIDQPERRNLVLTCALPRLLNVDIMAAIQTGDSAANLDWLKQLPFVQQGSFGWTYHSVVREQLLKQFHRDSPQAWSTHHEHLYEYWAKLRDSLTDAPQGTYANRRRCDLEALYHLVASGSPRATTASLGAILTAWSGSPSRARPYAATVMAAEMDSGLEPATSWGTRIAPALDRLAANDAKPALNVLSDVLAILDETSNRGLKGLAHACRASVYEEIDAFDAALSDLDEAAVLLPDTPNVYFDRAYIHELRGEMDSALKALDVAKKLSTDSSGLTAGITILRARVELTTTGPSTTIDALADLAAEDHPHALFTRGQAYRKLGRTPDAIRDFERAMQEHPPLRHDGYEEIAEAYTDDDELDKAETEILKALEINPGCSSCWTQIARIYSRKYPVEEALRLVHGTHTDSAEPRTIAGRAIALEHLEAYDEALHEYSRAIHSSPDDHWLLYARGNLYAKLDQLDEALEDLNGSLQNYSSYTRALIDRAHVLAGLERHAEAIRDFQRAAEIDPGRFAGSASDYGLELSRTGEYEKAIEIFETAVEKDPGPASHYNLAVAIAKHRGLTEAKDAIVAAREALDASDDEGRKAYGLAGLEALTGNKIRSFPLLRQAATLLSDVRSWVKSDPAWEDFQLEAIREVESVTSA